jgi:hypothetical protein
MKPALTAERLREMFHYDPLTGEFTYAITIPRTASAGRKVSRRPDSGGYVGLGIEGRDYRLHRLAWLYVHGEWPRGVIDHLNGDRTDNRIANLRDVPVKLNAQNTRRAPVHNLSGLQGVWSPRGTNKRFSAYIIADGVRQRIGYFPTAAEAHTAYIAAKRRLHEGCTI